MARDIDAPLPGSRDSVCHSPKAAWRLSYEKAHQYIPNLHVVFLVLTLSCCAGVVRADELTDYLDNWSTRAQAALDSEPIWIPPINTITPRLTQVVRYDQYWQSTGALASVDTFDAGKGVEIIPLNSISFSFNLPPYTERNGKGAATGWADWPVVLMKQRVVSAGPADGDYIVTGYLTVQAPTGSAAFTNHSWTITPGLGFGKGWSDFDIEGGVTAALPVAHTSSIGTAVTTNLLGQYHIGKFFWPEVEFNDTTWSGGSRRGLNELFMTVGSLFGNVPIAENYSLGIGFGYQFALTGRDNTAPVLNPVYDHNWILTLRLGY